MKKKAIVTGATGQDGRLLTRSLGYKGYSVIATSRDWSTYKEISTQAGSQEINHTKASLNCSSVEEWLALIDKHEPNEIYHLSAASSVGESLGSPWHSIIEGCSNTLAPLEALRISGSRARLFMAGSTECFGKGGRMINESAPLAPRSPYGVAKAQSLLAVKLYRDNYDLWTCTGIFSNHESPLRKEKFVTGKIINSIKLIKSGETNSITLGNVGIRRDWGWAEEYMEAAWLMLQAERAEDFIIATGKSVSLYEFAKAAFDEAGLSLESHLKVDKDLLRRHEVEDVQLSADSIAEKLGWRAQTTGLEVARKLACNSS